MSEEKKTEGQSGMDWKKILTVAVAVGGAIVAAMNDNKK